MKPITIMAAEELDRVAAEAPVSARSRVRAPLGAISFSRSRPGTWAMAAVAVYGCLLGGLLLGPGRGDPAWFVHFGRSAKQVALARQVLGADVVVPHVEGADGEQFWVEARDPLLLHPQIDAANLDRPAYRTQRIAYPALVAPWGLLGSEWLVWGLVLTNLALVGVGTAMAAQLVVDLGAPARAGLAFAFSPAVIASVTLDTGDTLAIAAILGALLLLRRGRIGWAVAAAVVAALAKEPMLLCCVAVGVLVPSIRRRDRGMFVGIPAAAATIWGLYARWRLGWPGSEVQEFSAPFAGYVDAYRHGWRPAGNYWDALVAVAVLGFAIAVIIRWWQRRTLLLAAALPFAVMVPFFSASVLDLADNSLRVLGPAITLFALDVYAGAFARTRESVCDHTGGRSSAMSRSLFLRSLSSVPVGKASTT